ncbi:MAG TPA: hypothetical protein P5228_02120 [Bacteroidales bacterium]|nr:hypothetical protein [Bacteroidales bacterium]HRZ50068.1 hypothetical protein [Bacteroidales bacterium]
MRKILTVIFLTVVVSVNAQNQFAIGFRMGDPSGLTVRLYTETDRFEMNLGRSHVFYGKGWYENQFDPWYKAQEFGYKEVQFLRYKTSFPLALQLHRIHQQPWKNFGGHKLYLFDWYYGYGLQLAFQKYEYEYRYKATSTSPWVSVWSTVPDIDVGLDGLIGLEYTVQKTPLRIFADLNLFIEVADNPFRFFFQSGVGVRYLLGVRAKE